MTEASSARPRTAEELHLTFHTRRDLDSAAHHMRSIAGRCDVGVMYLEDKAADGGPMVSSPFHAAVARGLDGLSRAILNYLDGVPGALDQLRGAVDILAEAETKRGIQ